MKQLFLSVLALLLVFVVTNAGAKCYVVTEDALAGDSETTWELANSMLKNQEMEKLTRLMLEGKLIVIKPGERVRMIAPVKGLYEIKTGNDEKKWFISVEVAKPCSQ